MRVKVESTGGFTGETTVVALYETSELPEKEALRVQEAVDSLAEARTPLGEVGADLPTYRITVTTPGNTTPQVFEVQGDPSQEATTPLNVLLGGT